MSDSNLLVGLDTGDDAAVYKINPELGLIFTVDFFPPVVDDPFSYGAVAAANSLSDVYAMGGKPLIALNIVGFPVDLPKPILGEILNGGYSKAKEAGCIIAGGHTVDDQEPKYGLAVIGLVTPGKEITNAGAKPGDKLLLTKPLGTGIITTAAKQDSVDDSVLQHAISIMSELNAYPSEAMMEIGVNSATDVTGFGLLGHLRGMMLASNCQARIYNAEVPAIPGVRDLIEAGVAPGGTHRNLSSMESSVHWHPDVTQNQKLLLCDAQTSGGLLISVPEEKTPLLLGTLNKPGHMETVIVGEVRPPGGPTIEVLP